MRKPLALAIAAVFALSACSSDPEPVDPKPTDAAASDEDRAAQLGRDWVDAVIGGQGEVACSLVTDEAREALSASLIADGVAGAGAECEELIERVSFRFKTLTDNGVDIKTNVVANDPADDEKLRVQVETTLTDGGETKPVEDMGPFDTQWLVFEKAGDDLLISDVANGYDVSTMAVPGIAAATYRWVNAWCQFGEGDDVSKSPMGPVTVPGSEMYQWKIGPYDFEVEYSHMVAGKLTRKKTVDSSRLSDEEKQTLAACA